MTLLSATLPFCRCRQLSWRQAECWAAALTWHKPWERVQILQAACERMQLLHRASWETGITCLSLQACITADSTLKIVRHMLMWTDLELEGLCLMWTSILRFFSTWVCNLISPERQSICLLEPTIPCRELWLGSIPLSLYYLYQSHSLYESIRGWQQCKPQESNKHAFKGLFSCLCAPLLLLKELKPCNLMSCLLAACYTKVCYNLCALCRYSDSRWWAGYAKTAAYCQWKESRRREQ